VCVVEGVSSAAAGDPAPSEESDCAAETTRSRMLAIVASSARNTGQETLIDPITVPEGVRTGAPMQSTPG